MNFELNKNPLLFSITSLKTGEFIEVSEQFLKTTGLKKEDVIGKTSQQLGFWKDEKTRKHFKGLIEADGFVKNYEASILLPQGSVLFSIHAEVVEIDNEPSIISFFNDITEKKNDEIALVENEEKYRTLVESISEGVYLIQDKQFKFVNEAFQNITGYNKEELLDKEFLGLIADEHRDFVVSNYIKRQKGEIIDSTYETIIICKDGSRKNVELTNSLITYNKKLATLGTIKDTTEKKKIEKELIESRQSFKDLIDFLPQIVFEINVKCELQVVNKIAFKAFGYKEEDFYPGCINVLDWVAPEDLERVKENISQAARGIPSNQSYKMKRTDGTFFHGLIFSSPIIKDGQLTGLRGLIVDISDRIKAEQELAKLSRAVEQSSVSVLITDPKGNLEYVNEKFVEITGYSKEEVIGKNPRFLKSGFHDEFFYKELWDTITGGNEWKGEIFNVKKDGSFYWEIASISPIRDKEGNITNFLAFKEDITQKKMIEEELVRAKDKAEESDRIKSNFLAQVSHEIRTPLNIILGYNSYLKSELKDKVAEEYTPVFDSIHTAGKRLFRTIDLILNMSMLQAGKVEPSIREIDLAHSLNILVDEFENTASLRSLDLKFLNCTNNSLIETDDYITSQIFQNLIDNAIKYTNTGKVEVILYKNDAGKMCVDVRDTGIGMSKEFLTRLFAPFTQEDAGYGRKYEGNGLGLALVKNYVELLNAEIKVESTRGKGTIFTVVF